MKWNESTVGGFLARVVFQRKVLCVPNCNWTGNECDMLIVTRDLRIIDAEIKVSRADLKADAAKDKWWQHRPWQLQFQDGIRHQIRGAKEWPPKVWKHYYCVPRDIWKPELLDCLPSPASGVIEVHEHHGRVFGSVLRRARPNKDAARLRPEDVIDIARLAGLRMWDAYDALRAKAA